MTKPCRSYVERHHKFANVITTTVMRLILTKLPRKASRLDVSNGSFSTDSAGLLAGWRPRFPESARVWPAKSVVFGRTPMIQIPKLWGLRIMRYELADYEWAAIKPMLPNKPRGVPRVNDRRVLNGIFWVLRSGAPWRDLPTAFGPTPLATTASSGGGGPVFGAASWK